MLFAALLTALAADGTLPAAYDLRTEYLSSSAAIGLTEPLPRFSWRLPSFPAAADRGMTQAFYRLLVVDQHSGHTAYDSGKVASNSTVGAVYAGEPLVPESAYNVTHTWFTKTGIASLPSSTAFEVAPQQEYVAHTAHGAQRLQLPLATNGAGAYVKILWCASFSSKSMLTPCAPPPNPTPHLNDAHHAHG